MCGHCCLASKLGMSRRGQQNIVVSKEPGTPSCTDFSQAATGEGALQTHWLSATFVRIKAIDCCQDKGRARLILGVLEMDALRVTAW